MHTLDCAAIFAPLAQAVGRIGNLVNGDIVGYQSTLPWAVKYTNPNNGFIPQGLFGKPVQPAAAYEFLFCLGLFAVLWPLRNKLKPAGMLFVLYLSLYCVGQFILFIWRDNDIVTLGLKQAQITAVAVQALLVVGAYFMLLKPWVFDPAYDFGEDEGEEYDDEYEDEDGEGLDEESTEDEVTGDGEEAPDAEQGQAAGATEPESARALDPEAVAATEPPPDQEHPEPAQ